MDELKREKKKLVDALIDEISDVVLICHLAYSGGSNCLRNLFEAVKDAEALSVRDLQHNLEMARQKKGEAHRDAMLPVFRRLMRLERTADLPLESVRVMAPSGTISTLH